MAKKSMVNREVKRTELAKKFAKKRAELKTIIKDEDRSYEEREASASAPAEAAARLEPGAWSQSVPPDRSSSRLLPQVRPEP